MPPSNEQLSYYELTALEVSPRAVLAPSARHGVWAALQSKVKCSDLLLVLFVAVFVRQYAWMIDSQALAWSLTFIIASLICGAHVYAREETGHALSSSFWLLVVLPLLFVYALRAPFPDFSYDVMNYHLVHAERALRGWPFIEGDFFPAVMHVNPAPEMVGGIFRLVLGYRLGTLVNLLALLWAAAIVDRFLSSYIKNRWWRGAGVLLVVSTEYILHLLSIYLIDLLALPLLLEATYLTLHFHEAKRKAYTLVHIALFLGICTAFKLTNAAIVIPIALALIYQIISQRIKITPKYAALAIFALLAPLVPFSLYMYSQTGSPVFPFYNKIFQSPYWLAQNFRDPIYGPKTFLETLLWPIYTVFYPERISEMSGLSGAYAGRISLGFVIAALCLAYRSVDKEIRILSFITVLSCLLWSKASGNVRYGTFMEITGALVLLSLLATLPSAATAAGGAATARSTRAFLPVLLFIGLLTLQSVISYRHVVKFDQFTYGYILQSTVFKRPGNYLEESKELLSDHSTIEYLSPGDRQKLDQVDVWLNSFYTTSGMEVMLKKDAPIIAVCDYFSMFDYFETEATRERFRKVLASMQGKRIFSVAYKDHVRESVRFITRSGLTIGEITPLDIHYFSQHNHLSMVLVEVLPPGEGMSAEDERLNRLATEFIEQSEAERRREEEAD